MEQQTAESVELDQTCMSYLTKYALKYRILKIGEFSSKIDLNERNTATKILKLTSIN